MPIITDFKVKDSNLILKKRFIPFKVSSLCGSNIFRILNRVWEAKFGKNSDFFYFK